MGSGKHRKAEAAPDILPAEDAPAPAAAAPATHPEEMRATVEIDIAGKVTFRATARATPAGLVSVAILLAAVMVPLAWTSRGRAVGRRF